MEVFALTVAIVPLGIYLIGMGLKHLRGRPHVQTGFSDTMFLGLGLSGMLLIGPFDLFVPETAAFRFGWFYRVLLGLLLFLVLLLIAISRKPRMIVHNVRYEDMYRVLVDVVGALDPRAEWAGRAAYLPSKGLDLFIDPEVPSKTIQVVSLSRDVNFVSWTALRKQLQAKIQTQPNAPNLKAAWLVGGGGALLLLAAMVCWRDLPALARGFEAWLIR